MTFVVAVLLALVVAPLRAELPPEAQAAMKKGVIAAQQQDYPLALRFFQDARKLAPDAPEVFYNLGLAESKIPGRELRAIAWFGAYLAANPTAPNATAVKEQMEVLDVKNQSNTSRFLKTVQAAANLIQDVFHRGWAQKDIASEQAQSGNIAEAQKTANLIQNSLPKSKALIEIAEAKIRAGDLAGAKKTFATARKTADLIDTEPSHGIQTSASLKADMQENITVAQAKSGDISGAQETAALILGKYMEGRKSRAETAIAIAQIRVGDIAGAKKTLAAALKTAELIQTEFKSEVQSAIAEVQAKAGDILGAQKTLVKAQQTAVLIQEAYWKSLAESAVAKSQIKTGDISGAQKTLASAQKTAELIDHPPSKGRAQTAIAETQIEAGDIAGAQKTVDLIQDAGDKSRGQSAISEAQLKANNANISNSIARATSENHSNPIQPVISVSDWLKELEGDLNTDPFLDLAGYLKSLLPSDTNSSENHPHKLFESLHETAKKIVTVQNVIHKMLKQLN